MPTATATPPSTRSKRRRLPEIEHREIELHGNRVCYRTAGEGPPLVLIHGIAGSSRTWESVIPTLAQENTVIAPDLLGHGESAKPSGDYSLGAYASGVRDLLLALGHDQATVVGHSLGGGIAMQYSYQFPAHVERLVLVSSGGLGREVNAIIRSAALPGAGLVLPLLAGGPVRWLGEQVDALMQRVGLQPAPDLEEVARSFASLGDLEARQAFIHTVRGIIDVGGQRASARDRLYLAEEVPTLIVWGERDPILPVQHGYSAHKEMPGSRLEVYPEAGHFPHRDEPMRFTHALLEFLDETKPAKITPDRIRAMLAERARA